MELSTLFGLPAHAFIVHAAVVLVPLAALALLVLGWKKEWRRIYGLPVLLLALAGGGFAFLAKSSGEPLEGTVRRAAQAQQGIRVRFGEHPEDGDRAFVVAVFFTIAVIAWFAIDRWGARRGLPAWSGTASYVVAGVLAVAATFAMVAAGHSGAELVWKDVGSFAAAGK